MEISKVVEEVSVMEMREKMQEDVREVMERINGYLSNDPLEREE